MLLALSTSKCVSPPDLPLPPVNKHQHKLHKLIDSVKEAYYSAANDAAKNDLQKSFENKIDRYLNDTLRGVLMNFKVTVTEVDYMPWRGKTALLFKSEDHKAQYWMEQHFKDEKEMKSSLLYKFLFGLQNGTDTTLSFIYFLNTRVNASIYTPSDVSIEVIPVSDSIAQTYLKRRQLPKKYYSN